MHFFSTGNFSKMPENNLNLLFGILHLTSPDTALLCQSGIFIASILHDEGNPFNKQQLFQNAYHTSIQINATLTNSATFQYLLIKCKSFSDLCAILHLFICLMPLIFLTCLLLKNILCFPVKSQFSKVVENCPGLKHWKLTTQSCRGGQNVDI